MNIKPCPACESEASELTGGFYGTKRHCLSCGVSGPWGKSSIEADAAWNALPRRGDAPAWRKEPPDREGWWWEGQLRDDGVVVCRRLEYKTAWAISWHQDHPDPLARFAGPISEPPIMDAEKEA